MCSSDLLPGAKEFLDELRSITQAVILSDSLYLGIQETIQEYLELLKK